MFVALGAASGIVAAIATIPLTVVRMELHVVQYNLFLLAQVLLYISIALYLVIVRDLGMAGIFIASVVAASIQLVLAVGGVRRYFTGRFSSTQLIRSVKYSGPIVPAAAASWVNNQSDRILLLGFIGLSGVGVFGVGFKVATLVKLLVNVFVQAWSPYAMRVLELNESDRNRFYSSMLNYYSVVFACLGILLTTFGAELIAILVPKEYANAYYVLPWLAGAAILHGSANITVMGFLLSERPFKKYTASW